MKKIAVLGLDNAGKTSIIQTISNNYENLVNPIPTKYIKMTHYIEQDHNFVFWEFGGQSQFRKQYTKNIDFYFSYFSFAIFVIDIQDPSRLIENLKYFEEIIEYFEIFSPNLKLYCYLHKMDNSFIIHENEKELKEKYKIGINSIISKREWIKNSFEIFETSIKHPTHLLRIFTQIIKKEIESPISISEI